MKPSALLFLLGSSLLFSETCATETKPSTLKQRRTSTFLPNFVKKLIGGAVTPEQEARMEALKALSVSIVDPNELRFPAKEIVPMRFDVCSVDQKLCEESITARLRANKSVNLDTLYHLAHTGNLASSIPMKYRDEVKKVLKGEIRSLYRQIFILNDEYSTGMADLKTTYEGIKNGQAVLEHPESSVEEVYQQATETINKKRAELEEIIRNARQQWELMNTAEFVLESF